MKTQYFVQFSDGTMQMTENYGEYLILKSCSGHPVSDKIILWCSVIGLIVFGIFLAICLMLPPIH